MTAYENAGTNIRSTAELLVNNVPNMSYSQRPPGGSFLPGFDMSRTHSINLITEEFLGGYMQDGRMSVIRRFFCLFVTFDVVFVSLLWLICTMINGESIYQAFQKQVIHYTIYTSLFDVVVAAVLRFLVLLLFYAILYVNHWFIIALSTSGSCLFLIAKVFVFDWVTSSQQVFQVILILTSFVLAWGEAWFLDCRVIPQERHARRYFNSITTTDDRAPLLAPFLSSQAPESTSNFYSPFDSAPNSDDEDEQDEEFRKMGIDCVRKVSELLESNEWKVEKVTSKGDTIHCMNREKLGKIYKLTARLKYPAKLLLDELFYKVEDVPKWNPTVLESKIVKKVNSYTDISYQTSASSGGGLVKSRDFVNLRCWRVVCNGQIYDEEDIKNLHQSDENLLNRSCESSVSTLSDGGGAGGDYPSNIYGSVDSNPHYGAMDKQNTFYTLSKSLGARGFAGNVTADEQRPPPPPPLVNEEPPPFDDSFKDLDDNLDESTKPPPPTASSSSMQSRGLTKDHVWISAAISIPYAHLPPTPKFIRGENLITGFAFREIVGKKDGCIMEWILCLDLKGYVPRYILDTAYTTFMTDYMTHLRKYINELKQKRNKSHIYK